MTMCLSAAQMCRCEGKTCWNGVFNTPPLMQPAPLSCNGQHPRRPMWLVHTNSRSTELSRTARSRRLGGLQLWLPINYKLP